MSVQWTACFRSALWIYSFVALMGPMNRPLHGQQLTQVKAEDTQERFVLLRSGRIMSGRVIQNAGGFLIEQNKGWVQLPESEVKFIVNNLHEGYYKERDSIVEPTPATHLALANWCISYRLYDEASDELKICLKADPDNEQARRLLQRLTELIRTNLAPVADPPVLRKTLEGFIPPQVEALGGLSRETALQFTSRIQPLMLNKCGNASCHGMASSNTFRVVSSRGSGHGSRQTAERNLSETLRQIDFDDVAKSKLLIALKGAHGGKGTIFVGQRAIDQIQSIRTWVQTVVQEKQAEKDQQEKQARLVGNRRSKNRVKSARKPNEATFDSDVRQASFNDDNVEELLDDAQDSAKPRETKPDPMDAAALAREPEDAFDPERFNRQFRR